PEAVSAYTCTGGAARSGGRATGHRTWAPGPRVARAASSAGGPAARAGAGGLARPATPRPPGPARRAAGEAAGRGGGGGGGQGGGEVGGQVGLGDHVRAADDPRQQPVGYRGRPHRGCRPVVGRHVP